MTDIGGKHSAAGAAVELTSEEATITEPTDMTDGRSLRRRRNRDAVIRALIDLINEGEVEPNIDNIAVRAEVSARSIFRYFTDLNDLARTAIEAEMMAALPVAVIPDRGEGDLEHRIDQILAARRRLFERVHRLYLVAARREHDIEEVERGLAMASRMLADQMRFQFATELDPLRPQDASEIAATMSAAMGLEAFDHLHRRLDRDVDEIFDGWRRLLERSFA